MFTARLCLLDVSWWQEILVLVFFYSSLLIGGGPILSETPPGAEPCEAISMTPPTHPPLHAAVSSIPHWCCTGALNASCLGRARSHQAVYLEHLILSGRIGKSPRVTQLFCPPTCTSPLNRLSSHRRCTAQKCDLCWRLCPISQRESALSVCPSSQRKGQKRHCKIKFTYNPMPHRPSL